MNCNPNRIWIRKRWLECKCGWENPFSFCSFNRNCMGIQDITMWTEYPVSENPESWESVSEKSFRKSALNTQSEFWKQPQQDKLGWESQRMRVNCQPTTPFLFFIVSCLWQFVKYRFDSVVNLMIWNHEGCTQHISIVLLLFEPLSRQLSVFNHKIGRP